MQITLIYFNELSKIQNRNLRKFADSIAGSAKVEKAVELWSTSTHFQWKCFSYYQQTCVSSILCFTSHIVHDSTPISMSTTWVGTICSGIGEGDPAIIVALSHRPRPPAHTGAPTGAHFNEVGRPVRTSENSSRIGSLPSVCEGLQQALRSLAVLMNREQSTHGVRYPFPNTLHVTTKALSLFLPV